VLRNSQVRAHLAPLSALIGSGFTSRRWLSRQLKRSRKSTQLAADSTPAARHRRFIASRDYGTSIDNATHPGATGRLTKSLGVVRDRVKPQQRLRGWGALDPPWGPCALDKDVGRRRGPAPPSGVQARQRARQERASAAEGHRLGRGAAPASGMSWDLFVESRNSETGPTQWQAPSNKLETS